MEDFTEISSRSNGIAWWQQSIETVMQDASDFFGLLTPCDQAEYTYPTNDMIPIKEEVDEEDTKE